MALRGINDSGLVAPFRNRQAVINLGIVGLGKWGQRHVDSANASGRFRVVRAVTPRPDKVADFVSTRSIAVSASMDDLLADPSVDALSLVTPNSLHAQQVMSAATAGKHVMVEKPFSLTRQDAENAVVACAKAGVVVAVGHDNRFYPAIVEIKTLVDAGTLGTILHAEANISHPGPERTRVTTPVTARNWRHDRSEAPAGPMVHLGIHRIDSFVQVFGKVDRVFAQTSSIAPDASSPDSVTALLRFCNGMTGYIGSSQATALNSRIQVFGSKGWVEATGPSDDKEYRRSSLNRIRVARSGHAMETREFDATDSVRANFEAFADAIEGKSPYPVSADELIHVVAVLEAVVESFQTGRCVSVS